MAYKWHETLWVLACVVLGAALILLGVFLGRLDFGAANWWVMISGRVAIGVGIVLVVLGVVSIGFVAVQATEMNCPHCRGKIVPHVTLITSHLRLSKGKEEAVGSAKEATKSPEH